MHSDSAIVISNETEKRTTKWKLVRMSVINLMLVLLIGLIFIFSKKFHAISKPTTPTQAAIMTSYETNEDFQHSYGKHLLTVYYEALCPDSERFMQQLLHAYDELQDYLQLEFVPFGLTKLYCKEMINGKCAHPSFSCKHGPNGCRANRLHGCVLQYSLDKEKQIDFMKCSMGTYRTTIERCISLLHFSMHDIDRCMTFEEGTELQLNFYNRTRIYKPTSLPVLVFDDVYDESFQTAALSDFRSLICDLLTNKYKHFNVENSPVICKTSDIFT